VNRQLPLPPRVLGCVKRISAPTKLTVIPKGANKARPLGAHGKRKWLCETPASCHADLSPSQRGDSDAPMKRAQVDAVRRHLAKAPPWPGHPAGEHRGGRRRRGRSGLSAALEAGKMTEATLGGAWRSVHRPRGDIRTAVFRAVSNGWWGPVSPLEEDLAQIVWTVPTILQARQRGAGGTAWPYASLVSEGGA
jgi:hypothetical protein